jgi:hypothetical protein
VASRDKRSYKNERWLLLPRGEKDLEARWRDGASQHEEDTPRKVLGDHHQVNKKVIKIPSATT